MKSLLRSICLLFLINCQPASKTDLTIAVAANMQFAVEELLDAFENKTGFNCDMVVSSSGKLTAQIKSGAPFDLMISADMKYPQDLFESGFADGPPVIYAYGKLVLWTKKAGSPPSLEYLTTPMAKHIAIANPKTAPYGAADIEVLEQSGIYETIRDKLVYGESILQTNQFILSGAADVGFTAKSMIMSGPMEGKGLWLEMDQQHYAPLAQGMVIIDNQNTELARQFFDFLLSPEGQKILQKYGYDAGVEF